MAFDRLRWIEISESSLSGNASAARRLLGNDTKISAVVKANAYGHGLSEIAPFLERSDDIFSFSVASPAEALELRSLGIEKDIVLLACFEGSDFDAIVESGAIPFVYNATALKRLAEAAAKALRKTRVLLKIDTGMGRLGAAVEDAGRLADIVAGSDSLELAGFSTHFAMSDAPSDEFTKGQEDKFNSVLDEHGSKIVDPDLTTAANTGAIIFGRSPLGMVRLGIGLYGLYPSKEAREARPDAFLPALEYKARVVETKELAPGSAVSYGATWKADKPSKIAVLPVGYADGYRRAFSNRASALINGVPAPVRGRVCMNFTMVDVTDVPGVGTGTIATLISADPEAPCSACALAEIADTINYEITTALPAGIPRRLLST